MASLRARVAASCRTLRRIPAPLSQSRRCGLRLSACPAPEKPFGADASLNPDFPQSPATTASRKNLRGGLLRAAIRESMVWPRGWAGLIRPPTQRGNHNTLRKKLQRWRKFLVRSEEHTSELQSRENLVCRLLLEKKKKNLRTIVGTRRRSRCDGR